MSPGGDDKPQWGTMVNSWRRSDVTRNTQFTIYASGIATSSTNLGPLRYIFVTPQSHRVHHSSEEEFFDMNYGVTLCIWDRLFGTHSHTDFAYPKTGIPDSDFPEEKGHKWYRAPLIVVQQLYYPFVKAIKLYWR